jgi:tetratricopeptide (TPR) repeat protein
MNRRLWPFLLLLALFAAALAGCNAFEGQADGNSREARLEAARIAMDRGDYETAVPLLQALDAAWPGDAEISRALASAYAGRAGLDLLGLAAQAAAAADNASLSAIDRLMKTLPVPATASRIADAERAVAAWNGLLSTPNDYYSLALSQATLGLLTLAKAIDPAGTGVDPARIPSISDVDAVTLYASIADALANLGPGKAGLAPDSDLLEAFARIKAEIDAVSPAAGAAPADIRAWLSSQGWR